MSAPKFCSNRDPLAIVSELHTNVLFPSKRNYLKKKKKGFAVNMSKSKCKTDLQNYVNDTKVLESKCKIVFSLCFFKIENQCFNILVCLCRNSYILSF